MTGRMLLILPNRRQALLGRYTGAELSSLLQYYTHGAIYAGHRSGFAAVADLGTCTRRDVIIKLVETLERMQVREKQLFVVMRWKLSETCHFGHSARDKIHDFFMTSQLWDFVIQSRLFR